MGYDFSTLNDKEFEELVRDLLNAQFGLDLQSFKTGRDKGVDLRYSTPDNNNAIVVQVKQYIKSDFNALKRTLVKDELPKIKKLKPGKYIVATRFVKKNWDDIIVTLLETSSAMDDVDKVLELFDKYDQDIRRFIKEGDNYMILLGEVNAEVDSLTQRLINKELHSVISKKDWQELKEKVKKMRAYYFTNYASLADPYDEEDFFNDAELKELIRKNKLVIANEKENGPPLKKEAGETDKKDHTDDINKLYRG